MKTVSVDPPPRTRSARYRRMVALLTAGAFGLTVFIAVPSSTLAAGNLTMTGFSPSKGPVGTEVTITGTGFVSGDIVAFNGTATTTTTAGKKGTKLKASVPAFATSGPITVTDPATQQTVGLPKAKFTVTSGLFATPNHVWAGESLTLEGSALSPDLSESIDLGKLNVGKAETDAFGDFSVSIAISWTTASGADPLAVTDPLGRFHVPVFIVGSWPTYRHDASHAAVDPYEPALTPSTVHGLSQQWNFNTGDSQTFSSSPAVVDGMVYVGSWDQIVYALNASTGAMVWSFTTGARVFSSPAVANGVVYVGSQDGNLYALDASTGLLEWAFATPGVVDSSPAVVNGVVYVGSDQLYALNASTGALEWTGLANTGIESSPAVANGSVYVAAGDIVYAVNASTGATEWSYATGAEVDSSPAAVNGVVYVGSFDDNVYALNASTGTLEWTYNTGGPVWSSPAVANGVVFVGSEGGKMYALNASTGALVWQRVMGGGVSESSAAVADGVVYIEADNGWVYALAAPTGALGWAHNAVAYLSSPAVADGMIYVSSDTGHVYAFGI